VLSSWAVRTCTYASTGCGNKARRSRCSPLLGMLLVLTYLASRGTLLVLHVTSALSVLCAGCGEAREAPCFCSVRTSQPHNLGHPCHSRVPSRSASAADSLAASYSALESTESRTSLTQWCLSVYVREWCTCVQMCAYACMCVCVCVYSRPDQIPLVYLPTPWV